MQTYTFEGDRAGKMLADALLSIRPVDVEILIDSWSKLVLSDRFLYWPQNMFDTGLRREALETRQMVDRLRRAGIQVTYTNPVGPFLSKLPNRNHKKLVLIDDRISYVGGINFSEHNFEWHDMMLRIDDRGVSRFLRTDFDRTMNGGTNSMGSRSFGDIEIHVTDGKLNGGQFAKIFKVIEGAEKRIHVHMPYITLPCGAGRGEWRILRCGRRKHSWSGPGVVRREEPRLLTFESVRAYNRALSRDSVGESPRAPNGRVGLDFRERDPRPFIGRPRSECRLSKRRFA